MPSVQASRGDKPVIKAKLKKWTIHVMWKPLAVGYSYTKAKHTLIINPYFAEDTYRYVMTPVPLESNDCPLDLPLRDAVTSLNQCYVNTGIWKLPYKPAAVMLDIDWQFDDILLNCIGKFNQSNSLEVPPTDEDTLRAVAFGYKVAQLIHKYYELTECWRSEKNTRVLRVYFHGWVTTPALLFLKRFYYMDHAELIFNVYNPVLGSFLPRNPSSLVEEAERSGKLHRYLIEHNSVMLADRVRSRGPRAKLISRQLLRGPNRFYLTKAEKKYEDEEKKSEEAIRQSIIKTSSASLKKGLINI